MGKNQKNTKLTFKAFLSHGYKSPAINIYFYEIFENTAEVQFEIDEGILSTNVTRLERMMRDADAFIGLYSLPSDSDKNISRDDLLYASRYFRLELELALRNKKPGIVFIDKRYGKVIKVPPSIIECRYDHNEIAGPGGSPTRNFFKIEFARFCETVEASMLYNDYKKSRITLSNKIPILLPERVSDELKYSNEDLDCIRYEIEQTSGEPVLLKWPPVINEDLIRIIEDADFVVVDINDPSGIVPYLQGLFVPMLRLCKKQGDETLVDSISYKTLFSNQSVGYIKDIIVWDQHSALESEINKRLSTIYADKKRFNTYVEAVDYFKSTALRKEPIFVSYSGKDEKIAQTFLSALKGKFHIVFDYKDEGESISPGKPWLEEIFNSLSKSSVGILLISEDYLKSGNCLHEARDIFAMRDNNKLKILPIKLYDEKTLKLPPFMGDTQYLRYWKYQNPELLVNEVIRLIDNK